VRDVDIASRQGARPIGGGETGALIRARLVCDLALSRVQGLLSRAGQEPITIGALIRLKLDALGRDGRREQVDITCLKSGSAVPSSRWSRRRCMSLRQMLASMARFSTDQSRLRMVWRLE
jgi:hypothetical protein